MSATKRNPDNLYQRNGVWYIRYNINGEKIRASLDTTSEREAKRLRDEILGKRSAAAKFGIEAPKPKRECTFAEVVALWLQSRRASGELRERSIEQAEQIARTRLLPVFGAMPMSEITVTHVERFIADLRTKPSKTTKRPLRRATIALTWRYFGAVYRFAIRRRVYEGPNPLEQLDRCPTQGPGRDVSLTEDEARRLLDKLSGETYYKVSLALATGLRWGEIHGLAWENVQLGTNPPMLTVRRSWRTEPKTEASATTIPISPDAAATLRRWRSEQGEGAIYVFPDHEGNLCKRSSRSEELTIQKSARKTGISKHVTPHVFRHTFGTWLYERTGDPKIIQRLMRHASFTTSMGYVHDRRELGEAVSRMPVLSAARLVAV